MSTEELHTCIADAVVLLENYRSFGPMVDKVIKAFNRIGECVADPTPEQKAEAKELIGELMKEIGPYQSYVPSVALALEKLKKWSED